MDTRPIPLVLEPAELREREGRAWRSGFALGAIAGAFGIVAALFLVAVAL